MSEELFPPGDGPFEAWPAHPAVPTGAAADAHYEAGPLGLDDSAIDPDSQTGDDEEAPAPIERFRYMELQGEVIKVRCVPLWQWRLTGMLDGSDEDEKAQERLVRDIKSHKPETRAKIVTVLMGQLKQEGRGSGATAGRLSGIKLPKEDGASNGDGGGLLPAAQRNGKVLNG
jgi:hypothetical protein